MARMRLRRDRVEHPGTGRTDGASLSEVAVGSAAVVRRVAPGPHGVGARLAALGLLPGTNVKVVRRAPLGDPVVVELRGYQLCLRRRDAGLVAVAGNEPGGR